MQKVNYTSIPGIVKYLDELNPNDLIIIDKKVVEIYPDVFSRFEARLIHVDNPEKSKNLELFSELSETCLKMGINRDSKIIAIGGGALSDLAGFVASTLLRGVKLVIIPTTLLAMVDAAIGGKTAINSSVAKNQIGTFYPAFEVLIATDFLETLPNKELECGKGEILKYGFLSTDIYKLVIGGPSIEDLIKSCVEYKLEICRKDINENNLRKVLNFGHTYAHAIEHSRGISHGQAVMNGIYTILHLFAPDLLSEFVLLKEKLKIKEDVDSFISKEEFKLINFDKKNTDDGIDLVIVKRIGEIETKKLSLDELYKRTKVLWK